MHIFKTNLNSLNAETIMSLGWSERRDPSFENIH